MGAEDGEKMAREHRWAGGSHWSRFNEARLSLVESFRVLKYFQYIATPEISCLSEPSRASKATYLLLLVLYDKRTPIIDPFRAWKPTSYAIKSQRGGASSRGLCMLELVLSGMRLLA